MKFEPVLTETDELYFLHIMVKGKSGLNRCLDNITIGDKENLKILYDQIKKELGKGE